MESQLRLQKAKRPDALQTGSAAATQRSLDNLFAAGSTGLSAAASTDRDRDLYSRAGSNGQVVAFPAPPKALTRPKRSDLETASAVTAPLARYHSYEVSGLENLPAKGRCIVAFNHSLATYDIGLFMREVLEKRGREMRMLADHLFFQVPGLRNLARAIGLVDGRPDLARAVLKNGELVGVAPGGMREAIRPSTQAYEILWDEHKGFARLALETQTPIVLAACPAADDIYRVIDNPITRAAYKYLRFPVPVAVGRWFTPFPKKVSLVHTLSAPIAPPALPRRDAKRGDPDFEAAVDRYHKQLIAEMRALMKRARGVEPIAEPSREETRRARAA